MIRNIVTSLYQFEFLAIPSVMNNKSFQVFLQQALADPDGQITECKVHSLFCLGLTFENAHHQIQLMARDQIS